MLKEKNNKVLFCGLTHVGQVFSVGWAEKVGSCAVYDFDKRKIKKFKKDNVTTEEPNLKKYLVKNKKKNNIRQIIPRN